MYVCVYVCNVCMCVYMYVYVYVCMYVIIYLHKVAFVPTQPGMMIDHTVVV
jgi:hypothetical protein